MQGKRIGVDDFFGLNDDHDHSDDTSEGFHTAHSHPSTDESESQRALDPTFETEHRRLLSEEDNEMVNTRVDYLVEVLQNSLSVRFEQDPYTGEVDISANMGMRIPDQIEYNDVEAQIAVVPQNFGNIISSRRQMIRSLSSIPCSWSTIASNFDCQENGMAEEKAKTAPWMRNHPDSPLEKMADIRRAVRFLEEEAGDPRGSRLVRMGSEEIEISEVSPIPLEFHKRLRAATPSIKSEDQGSDRSSPLFIKSYLRRLENGQLPRSPSEESGERTFSPERVFAWLDHVEAPSRTNEPGEEGRRAFHVLREDPGNGDNPRQIPRRSLVSKALKDISNLGRPGYLQHNSFARNKGQEGAAPLDGKPKPKPKPISLAFDGAQDQTARRAYINSRWPGFLGNNGHNSGSETLRPGPHPISQDPERSRVNDTRVDDRRDEPPSGQPMHQDPERAAHFELALARLEGRATPPETSPIRRTINPHSMYGSDVEVDINWLQLHRPIPVRYE